MSSRTLSLRSVGGLTAASTLTLAAQFLYQLLLARYFGSSAAMDAYGAALAPPSVVSMLLLGSFGAAFLPRYVQLRDREGETAGNRLAASLGWLLILALAAVSGAASWGAEPFMRLLYSGFQPEELRLAAGIFRWLVWLALLNTLYGFLQILHYARQDFVTPAIATVVSALVTLGWTWWRASQGITAAVEGVLLGASVSVGVQLPLFARIVSPRIHLRGELATVLALGLPLLFASLFRLEPQIDRYLAAGMPAGTIARLGYSKALVQALFALTTSGLAIALFPVLARLAADRHFAGLQRELGRTIRFLVLALTPISFGLWRFATPLVAAAFERGAFTNSDTRAVALLLVLQLGVVIGGSFGDIFAKVFYSLSDTRTPAIIGVASFAVGIGLKLAWQQQYGAAGLVAASSIFLTLGAIAMGFVLHRRIGRFAGPEVLVTTAKALAATVAAIGCADLIVRRGGTPWLIAGVLASIVVYEVALLLLREPLAGDLLAAWRLRRRSTEAPDEEAPTAELSPTVNITPDVRS